MACFGSHRLASTRLSGSDCKEPITSSFPMGIGFSKSAWIRWA